MERPAIESNEGAPDGSSDAGVVGHDLVGAMATICWGAFFAGGGSAAVDPFAAGDRVRINLVALVGMVVLLVGLVKVPVAHLPTGFRARRNSIAVVVAVALTTTTAERTLPGGLAVAVASLATWLWPLLLIDFVRRLLSHLGAVVLATQWRRVIAAWLTLGVASLGLSVAMKLTLARVGDRYDWTVFAPPGEDQAYRWWFLGVAIVLFIATAVLFVIVLVLGVRTMRRLRADTGPGTDRGIVSGAGTASTSHERGDAELAPGRGQRLRRDGDRIIYLVDPTEPP